MLTVFGWSPVYADYPNSVLDSEPFIFWRMNDERGAPAVNLGTGGSSLDGTYTSGGPGASGPSELADGTPLLGFAPSNVAFDTGAPGTYLGVDTPVLSSLSEFTLSGWFNPRELSGSRIGLFGQNDVVELGLIDSGTIQLWTSGGGAVNWSIGDQVATGQWYHLAAVGNGNGLELFLNGQSVQTGGTPIAANYGESDSGFRVGGGGVFDAEGNEFRGTLDEVAVWDRALTAAEIETHFEGALSANAPGDFNGNGRLDVDDLESLIEAVLEQSEDIVFDVTEDEIVDEDDFNVWVSDLRGTWFGDANLDGEFNSGDFVTVFVAGEYEDTIPGNSTWAEGDWNLDREFDTKDLVEALAEGGFERGPLDAASPSTVPEPSTLLGFLCATLSLTAFRRSA